ncbi:MAG TPA: DUF5667 domain-containing protein [Actinomycetota bacterium]|nr:DUF5667 domain-containing protein [Actinomycetota bacterium]
MRKEEVLDRAVTGQMPATPAVAELVELARQLEGVWAEKPSARAAKLGLARALDAYGGNGQVVEVRPELSRGRRFAASAAIALAAMVSIPGIARATSEDALPGDALYSVKLGFEQIRVILADGPAEEAAIHLDLTGERLEEAVLSAYLGRPEAEQEAVRRYAAAVRGFDVQIGRARALGLDVALLVARAEVLLEQQHDVLAALIARPGDPSVPGIRKAIEAIKRAKGHGGPGPDKPDKAKQNNAGGSATGLENRSDKAGGKDKDKKNQGANKGSGDKGQSEERKPPKPEPPGQGSGSGQGSGAQGGPNTSDDEGDDDGDDMKNQEKDQGGPAAVSIPNVPQERTFPDAVRNAPSPGGQGNPKGLRLLRALRIF